MDLAHLPPLPSLAQYKQALPKIKAEIKPKQMKMLKFLFETKDHRMTASELAAKVGYANYRGTNLQIGLLGNLVRDELHYWDEGGQASYILCYFIVPETQGNTDWIFVLHDVVVQALKELKWF